MFVRPNTSAPLVLHKSPPVRQTTVAEAGKNMATRTPTSKDRPSMTCPSPLCLLDPLGNVTVCCMLSPESSGTASSKSLQHIPPVLGASTSSSPAESKKQRKRTGGLTCFVPSWLLEFAGDEAALSS